MVQDKKCQEIYLAPKHPVLPPKPHRRNGGDNLITQVLAPLVGFRRYLPQETGGR